MVTNDLLTAALSRRTAVLGGATLSIASMGMASSQSTPAATPASVEGTPGGTLRVGVQGDPASLDPALVILDAAGLVIEQSYEGLVHEDDELNPQPRLAESWDISADGLTYTFHLRKGVTFHNGRAFVADDVLYSFKRVMDEKTASPWRDYTASINEITAPDDATVVITLKRPDAAFLAALCRRGLSIVPKEEVEKTGDLKQAMVGTGPFTFVEYVPNSVVKFARNPNYWQPKRPYVDALELMIIPDDTARTTALVSKTVDMIEAVPSGDVETIKATEGISLIGGQMTNLRWIVFNMRREPFKNKAFRKAVAAGIVRKDVIETAVYGLGTPLHGVYPKVYWAGYEGDVPAGDPAAAKQQLSEMNLPENFQPGLLTWGEYDFLSNTSINIQEQLKQMGIETKLEPEENATYLQRHFGGDYDIAVMGAGGYIDPSDFLFQTMRTGGTTNAAGYSNPEMDALLEEGIREQDREKRKAIYQHIQELIIEDAPWIMLYTSDAYIGVAQHVQGFTHSLSGSMGNLKNTWVSQQTS